MWAEAADGARAEVSEVLAAKAADTQDSGSASFLDSVQAKVIGVLITLSCVTVASFFLLQKRGSDAAKTQSHLHSSQRDDPSVGVTNTRVEPVRAPRQAAVASDNPHEAAVRENWRALEDVPLEQRSRELMLTAVGQDWSALQYVAGGCADREIMLRALEQDPLAVQFAALELREDQELMLKVVERNGLLLEETGNTARACKEVVLEAVRQNGLALEYAADEIRDDEEVVLAAVQQAPLALVFASERMLARKELTLQAVRNDHRILELLISKSVDVDYELALCACQRNGAAFEIVPAEFQTKELILAALRSSKSRSDFLGSVDETLFADQEFVLELLAVDGKSLKHMPETLRKDPRVSLAALAQTRHAKTYVPPELWLDAHFSKQANAHIKASQLRSRLTRAQGPRVGNSEQMHSHRMRLTKLAPDEDF